MRPAKHLDLSLSFCNGHVQFYATPRVRGRGRVRGRVKVRVRVRVRIRSLLAALKVGAGIRIGARDVGETQLRSCGMGTHRCIDEAMDRCRLCC